jgi:hypothetical protein
MLSTGVEYDANVTSDSRDQQHMRKFRVKVQNSLIGDSALAVIWRPPSKVLEWMIRLAT